MTRLIFYIVYVLLFCIGGLLVYSGIFEFRMVYAAFLPLLLIPVYGVRLTITTALFGVLGGVVILSGLVNHSSQSELLQFFRFIITPFAMYYLARVAISPRNIRWILKLSLGLGLIQLPVVLAQKFFYSTLIQFSASRVAEVDFRFGTFYIADDPAMSFFLIGLVLFLLFDQRHNFFIRRKRFYAAWLIATILIANSVAANLAIVLIVGVYLIKQVKSPSTLFILGIVSLIIGGFLVNGSLDAVTAKFASLTDLITKIVQGDTSAEERFLSGAYGRSAAVLYYLNQPLKILGDGPSKYYNPATRSYTLGNTGQLFTFYAEIGLIGLLVGLLILYQIAFHTGRSSPAIALPYFLTAVLLMSTTSVMSDASIMLAYNIFLSTRLIAAEQARVARIYEQHTHRGINHLPQSAS